MDYFKTACSLLPQAMSRDLLQYTRSEEIRLRLGRQPSFFCGGAEKSFSEAPVTQKDILHVIEKATGASVHSVITEMRRGYIDYKGLRIGLCGQALIRDGKFQGFGNYSSLSVRIPHQLQDIGREIIDDILNSGAESTLIIGPPGAGKTTILRELIRRVSGSGFRVSVADERNELSGMYLGEAQFDLGGCTDIITDMKKAEASVMLLRGMNPQIIAMDEITQPEDVEAIFEIAGCGVALFASAHGRNPSDMRSRRLYAELFDAGIFRNLIEVFEQDGKRFYSLKRV